MFRVTLTRTAPSERERHSTLDRWRTEIAQRLLSRWLIDAASRTPVDTGRARNSLHDLSRLTTGRDASVAHTTTESQTQIDATSTVPYLTHLEYGTASQAPFAMVRISRSGLLARTELPPLPDF